MKAQKLSYKEFWAELKSTGCRSFDPKITKQQISQASPYYFPCWGAQGFAVVNYDEYKETKAFIFKVSAMKFEGFVVISLNGADLYDVDFYEMKFTNATSETPMFRRFDLQIEGLYFENLGEEIDYKIETDFITKTD